MKKISDKDVEDWKNRIKKKGFKKFKLKELPEELRNKRMLIRAKVLGKIEKIDKDVRCIATWKFLD